MLLPRLHWVAAALTLLALIDMPVRFSHGQEGALCVAEPALAAGTTVAAADDVAEVAEEERSEEQAVSDVSPMRCPPAEAEAEAGPVSAAVPTETPIARPGTPPAPAAAARATTFQAVALLPPLTPGPGTPAVALFQKPFVGEFVVTNFFDHDLPFQYTDTNGHQLTW